MQLRNEDNNILATKERDLLVNLRESQISKINLDLGLQKDKDSDMVFEEKVRDMAKKFFGIEYSDFEDIWDTCLEMITIKEKANFEILQITDEKKKKQLRKVLNRLS